MYSSESAGGSTITVSKERRRWSSRHESSWVAMPESKLDLEPKKCFSVGGEAHCSQFIVQNSSHSPTQSQNGQEEGRAINT